MNLTDTHCHLNFEIFENDLDAVIENAQQVGVKRILVPGVDINSSISAIQLSEKYDFIYAAVGIHPNSVNTWNKVSEKNIHDLADNPNVIAIGEIGLDFYRKYTPPAHQIKALEAQLSIAANHNLPISIHNREASDVLYPILIDWQKMLPEKQISLKNYPGVLHAFNKSHDLLDALIETNYMFGIGGPITFNNATNLKELVRDLPIEKIIIETDSPFLTPHPKRGKRNVPANTLYIAQKIAEIINMSLTDILEITNKNADLLFGWRKSD